MATRDRDDRIRLESERGPGNRALKECGVLVIANDSIGDSGCEPVGGTAAWNSEPLKAWPSAILDRGPAAGLDNLDHDVGTKRNRSPGLKRAGGSAVGSKRRRAVRPIRFHPPGLSTA
jgi:hypothetical protein